MSGPEDPTEGGRPSVQGEVRVRDEGSGDRVFLTGSRTPSSLKLRL